MFFIFRANCNFLAQFIALAVISIAVTFLATLTKNENLPNPQPISNTSEFLIFSI